MKLVLTLLRNRNIRYAVPIVLALLGLIVVFRPRFAINQQKWLFIYYMSYDNDLYAYNDQILRMLEKGAVNPNHSIVVQADFPNSIHMQRIAIGREGRKTVVKHSVVESDESASPAELKKYLDWALENFESDNYVLVFLDHGGKLNEMCFDAGSDKWMDSAEAGKVCGDFNKNTGGKVRLLFLQQCGRGSVQNLYSFKDSAEYLLCSPVILGAPNTYYSKMLWNISESFGTDGEEIGRLIIKYDTHYGVYALVDSQELAKFAEKVGPLADALENSGPRHFPSRLKPLFEYDDEKNYDLRDFLEELVLREKNGEIAGKKFLEWYEKDLVICKKSGMRELAGCSGLSIFVPADKNQEDRYGDLPVYKDSRLKDILHTAGSVQQ